MAEVTRVFFLRHLRSEASRHVVVHRGGRRTRSARGAGFWFLPMAVSIAEVPVDDRELPILFRGNTLDFQPVVVQGGVTWRVVEPELLADRVDFTIDLVRGHWSGKPLEQVGGIVTELAQQVANAWLGEVTLADALAQGLDVLRDRIAGALARDRGLEGMGVAVSSVRIAAVRADAEVERALQTPVRESIQQQADRATFDRRAHAVERERAIAENELQNKIEARQARAAAHRPARDQRAAAHAGGGAGAQDRRRGHRRAAQRRVAVGGGGHPRRRGGEDRGRARAGRRLPRPGAARAARPRCPRAGGAPARHRQPHHRPRPHRAGPVAPRAGGLTVEPRAVLVTRPTGYQGLLEAHGTHGQAAWFLDQRGEAIAPLQGAHRAQERAVDIVWKAIPSAWRRTRIDRADLDRFLFEPEDVVVAVGQDGLVANVAKYLDRQPVIGVNPGGYDGVLVRHAPEAAAALLGPVADGAVPLEDRTRVLAQTDDGQRLLALNEIYLGHRTHQSARYVLHCGEHEERHSSSGVIVASGTGCTGWARSIARSRLTALHLPDPEAEELVFFVREAWPSRHTGTDLVEGLLAPGEALVLTSEMHDGGVCFGDGIESDALLAPFAREIRVGRAPSGLRLA
ncbi:MAG: SPFH domain-containing protein [Myxococcota bacterium]